MYQECSSPITELPIYPVTQCSKNLFTYCSIYRNNFVTLSDFPKYPGYERYDVSNILFNLYAEMHSPRNLIKVVSDIPKLIYCSSFIRGQQNCGLLIHRCAIDIFCRSQTALAGARPEIYHIDRTEHHLYGLALFLVVGKRRSASLILGRFFH